MNGIVDMFQPQFFQLSIHVFDRIVTTMVRIYIEVWHDDAFGAAGLDCVF